MNASAVIYLRVSSDDQARGAHTCERCVVRFVVDPNPTIQRAETRKENA